MKNTAPMLALTTLLCLGGAAPAYAAPTPVPTPSAPVASSNHQLPEGATEDPVKDTLDEVGKKVEHLLTSVNVFVVADGKGSTVAAPRTTVKNFLQRAGVRVGPQDKVSAPMDSLVEDKQLITITRVMEKPRAVKVPLPFTKKTSPTAVVCSPKEKTKITTPGKSGERTEVWADVYENSIKKSTHKVSESITIKPIDEITSPCLPQVVAVPKPASVKKAEAPQVAPKKTAPKVETVRPEQPEATTRSDRQQTKHTPRIVETQPREEVVIIEGGKVDWMRAAGIPESDWVYVDYIVNKESTWNPNAVNRSSGACGLVQALPCSKLGPNWNDPVHALQWQYEYVQQRYGGYKGAYDFWVNHHWY